MDCKKNFWPELLYIPFPLLYIIVTLEEGNIRTFLTPSPPLPFNDERYIYIYICGLTMEKNQMFFWGGNGWMGGSMLFHPRKSLYPVHTQTDTKAAVFETTTNAGMGERIDG